MTPDADSETAVFVHVPKTAGTSFIWSYVPAAFAEHERFVIEGTAGKNASNLARFRALSDEDRNDLRIVAGHNSHVVVDVIDRPQMITVLRDPVDQIRSTYFHTLTNDPDSHAARKLRHDGVTLATFSRWAWNPQSQALGELGRGDPADVLAAFQMVAVTEEMDRSLFHMHLRFGFPLVLFTNRLVSRRARDYTVSRRERRIIRATNELDVELYELARERFKRDDKDLIGPAEERLLAQYQAALQRFRSQSVSGRREGVIWRHSTGQPRSRVFSGHGAANAGPTVEPPTMTVKEPPLVSFVTTTYQSRDFLERCLASVRTQTYPHYEHVVQDAASTDGSIELLEEAGDKVDWQSQADNGESEGLNRALKRVRGDHFVVLNADDMALPNAAQWSVDAMAKHPDAGAVYGDQFLVDARDEVIGMVLGPDPADFEKILCVEQVPPAQASFIRTAAMQDVGMYADESLDTCPDHEMWVRLGLRHPIVHEPGLITLYRYHNTGKGRQSSVIDQMVRDKKSVNERVWNDEQISPKLRRLRRRANSSLSLWAASMCIDAGDMTKALRYMALGAATGPSAHWRRKAFGAYAHWRYRRQRIDYLDLST